MKIVSTSSSIYPSSPTETDRSEETSRVLRTITSAQAISQTEALKASSLPQSKISDTDSELAARIGQIAENNGVTPETWDINIEETLKQLEENEAMLNDPKTPVSTDKRGFLLQVNQLVAEIMQLLSKLSERDQNKTNHLKKEYNILNGVTVGSLKSQGKWNFIGSVVNFGTMIVCSALGASSAAQPLGSMAQSGVGFYGTKFSQRERNSSNQMSLLSTELQNMGNSNDISSLKNETMQMLEAAKKCLQDAARSNG